MVENLHRLPQTRANWFFFQKTKNYKVILGGFKGGLRTGAKLGAWTAGFCTLKEAFTLVPAIERRNCFPLNWSESKIIDLKTDSQIDYDPQSLRNDYYLEL
ncbi:uncharacterized protein PGTG_06626 [Puccinia graminis f. sp. tritici CRL 75-36-700-3]|uniref:Uncharacterized protein n=1 Tax=Puccinia graminis f. sp. tritici (strain CRL 75-36-700-3 / race SCCL) TaxID=418459 RepID=E3K909_PUCGT|nr:uncharacterized protein PGTG_06626 [Puccinia graminis f. sp. tritici CRL 75-36-700-3]EFP80670.1 hypothetical protein PGTG_06626 [Puccinia graminis f. sp. tritici CRL 75-36-700-3]